MGGSFFYPRGEGSMTQIGDGPGPSWTGFRRCPEKRNEVPEKSYDNPESNGGLTSYQRETGEHVGRVPRVNRLVGCGI